MLSHHDIIHFLHELAPFATLSREQLQKLIEKLKPKHVPVDDIVVRQGDVGSECYILRQGKLEVITAEPERSSRQLAILEAGAFFGEAALVAGTKRNATVRAVEPSDLFVLQRDDLVEIMKEDHSVRNHLLDLLSLRDRPKRKRHVHISEQLGKDGSLFFILKEEQKGLFYHLSPEGYFIWQQLDGAHTLKDLTLAYFERFKIFAPHIVAEVIGSLGAAGFLEGRAAVVPTLNHTTASRWQRFLMRVQTFFEWKWIISDVDSWMTKLYCLVPQFFLTKLGLLSLSLPAVIGLVIFFIQLPIGLSLVWQYSTSIIFLLSLVFFFLLLIFIHECGHALATKAFGRQIFGVGVGWYWITPIFFVDTSDMWLCQPWQRITVSLAGPYVNMVCGGLAAILGLIFGETFLAALCWGIALFAYLGVFLSLNPLLEYDGYYVLADLFNRPNLRFATRQWLKRGLPLKGHGAEFLYGMFVIVFALMFWLTLSWLLQ